MMANARARVMAGPGREPWPSTPSHRATLGRKPVRLASIARKIPDGGLPQRTTEACAFHLQLVKMFIENNPFG
ncbi:hypothetical protein [Azospirillum argentinense]|uniref:hypothetical protein n=1 Tax=Azospirillum argentinense TaxID=2970906 RepID=UPI001185B175|nr:hypothetical protein [Azospirillum argentinense]